MAMTEEEALAMCNNAKDEIESLFHKVLGAAKDGVSWGEGLILGLEGIDTVRKLGDMLERIDDSNSFDLVGQTWDRARLVLPPSDSPMAGP